MAGAVSGSLFEPKPERVDLPICWICGNRAGLSFCMHCPTVGRRIRAGSAFAREHRHGLQRRGQGYVNCADLQPLRPREDARNSWLTYCSLCAKSIELPNVAEQFRIAYEQKNGTSHVGGTI